MRCPACYLSKCYALVLLLVCYVHLLVPKGISGVLHSVFELVQVAEAEEKTAGGLLLTEASKEKPSIGTVRGL